jgi:hypothetical protein
VEKLSVGIIIFGVFRLMIGNELLLVDCVERMMDGEGEGEKVVRESGDSFDLLIQILW